MAEFQANGKKATDGADKEGGRMTEIEKRVCAEYRRKEIKVEIIDGKRVTVQRTACLMDCPISFKCKNMKNRRK